MNDTYLMRSLMFVPAHNQNCWIVPSEGMLMYSYWI